MTTFFTIKCPIVILPVHMEELGHSKSDSSLGLCKVHLLILKSVRDRTASRYIRWMGDFNRRYPGLRVLALVVFGLILVPVIHAQTTTGSVQGAVIDSNGVVITGVEVTAQNVDTGINQDANINITMQVQSAAVNVDVAADVQPVLDQKDPTLSVPISGTVAVPGRFIPEAPMVTSERCNSH